MKRQPRLIGTVAVLLWSTVVWTALWTRFTLVNVIWGMVVGALTLVIVPLPQRLRPRARVRPLALLHLVGHFLWALVRASTIVAWEVVTPRNRIHEGIVAAPLRTDSPGLITLIANAISLTPGTLTLEVTQDPPVLYVHILHLRTIDEIREEIRRLEDLVLAAFPPQTITVNRENP